MHKNGLYHLGFRPEEGAEYAVLTGDPGRVERIASFFDNPRQLALRREYNTWVGELEGERVLAVSTGIGGPSAAIAVEELYMAGVRTFIRRGTCGGMQSFVEPGSLIIPTAAIRAEGLTREYMPIEFPAAADFEVTEAIRDTAKSFGFPYHLGVIQSKDSFYGQHSPYRMPVGRELEAKWDAWIKAGCLASEMECAAIFIVARTLGARAGAVLHTVWNQEYAGVGMDRAAKETFLAEKTSVEAIRRLIISENN